MTTYTDHEQRLLDQQTGAEMDRAAERRERKDERSGADRCWIWRDGHHYAQVSFTRPDPKLHASVEYMRVLSRPEVERAASGEDGVDSMQLINSLHRRVENQLREINRLKAQLAALDTSQKP
jgi:hypothetical protein